MGIMLPPATHGTGLCAVGPKWPMPHTPAQISHVIYLCWKNLGFVWVSCLDDTASLPFCGYWHTTTDNYCSTSASEMAAQTRVCGFELRPHQRRQPGDGPCTAVGVIVIAQWLHY